MIEIQQLRTMFAEMRAHAPWNVDGPLLWGYFFTDRDPEKLRPVAEKLLHQGYTVVDLYPTDDQSEYFLHVEKVEHHTPESLDERNQEFDRLAAEFELDSYDGMDVGEAP